jgi:hypothetical protein
MISAMLSLEEYNRPSAKAVYEHLFFWDDAKKFNFIKVIKKTNKETFSLVKIRNCSIFKKFYIDKLGIEFD